MASAANTRRSGFSREQKKPGIARLLFARFLAGLFGRLPTRAEDYELPCDSLNTGARTWRTPRGSSPNFGSKENEDPIEMICARGSCGGIRVQTNSSRSRSDYILLRQARPGVLFGKAREPAEPYRIGGENKPQIWAIPWFLTDRNFASISARILALVWACSSVG